MASRTLGLLVLLLLMASGFSAGASPIEVDDLLARITAAVDPNGKSRTVKNHTTIGEMRLPAQNISMSLSVKFVEPDKQVITVDLPGVIQSSTYYNGPHGWEVSSLAGERLITGEELALNKLMVAISSNGNSFRDVFSEITLGEKVEVDGVECHQLICVPHERFDYKHEPVIMFVDPHTYLPKRMDITAVSQMGTIRQSVLLDKYQDFDGILVATQASSQLMGISSVVVINSVEFNTEIDMGIFQIPESLADLATDKNE